MSWYIRIFIFFFMLSSLAQAQEIKKIMIPDVGEWGQDRVLDLLAMNLGQNFSEAELEKGLKRLANTGRFQKIDASFDIEDQVLRLNLRLFDVVDSIEVSFGRADLGSSLRELLRKDIIEAVALNRGDQISLDQISLIRSRVLRRMQDRGFLDSEIVIVLEETSEDYNKKLFVSLNPREQLFVDQIEFVGFGARDLQRLRSIMEKTDYVKPYLSHLDIPSDIIDKPEEYLINRIRQMRAADDGKPVIYTLKFPLDQVLISDSLRDWGFRMKSEGYFDFNLNTNVVEGEGKRKLFIKLDKGLRYNLQFVGNVNFWERRLRERALDRPVRLGLAFSATEVISMLKSLYMAEGFRDISVIEKTEINNGVKKVIFEINEGPRFYLGDLSWDGISSEEKEILDEIERVWRQNMSSPFHPIYFDQKAVKQQLPLLLDRIRAEGFLQARFLGSRFIESEDSKRINLEIPLQLGPRFTLREIKVDGLHPLTETQLLEIYGIESGDLVGADKVLEISDKLLSAIREEGYLMARVSDTTANIVRYSDTTDEVDLLYSVDLGPKIQVGQIIVDGLRRTKEIVVLREFDREGLSGGDFWSPSRQARVDEKLLSYGLFNNLRMQMASSRLLEPVELGDSLVELQERDLRVTVSERPGGAIEFGPGYRTDLGVVAFGEYSYRNIGGLNRSVILRGQISRKINNFQFYEQRYSLSFLEPYVLGIPWSLRFATRYEKRDEVQYNSDSEAVGGFNAEEVSFSFFLGKEFTKNISLSHNLYSLSKPRIFDLQGDVASDTQIYRIATMGPSLVFDYRDNIFNPNSGWILSTAFEYASPRFGSSADVHYMLTRNEFSFYSFLRPGLVWANSFSFSYMRSIEEEVNLPVDRRLVLGGRNSIRSLPEKSVRYDQENVHQQKSYLVKTELRQKLFHDLGLGFFFDTGKVSAEGQEPLGWRESIGVGLRYVTAVGPLSLDFAFNADQRPGEDFSRILFSVGVF